jgi:hypothetical protein
LFGLSCFCDYRLRALHACELGFLYNMPAKSFFTYSISRQYPARFTWIILAGGAVLITFFTFVAVAGNAYQMDTKYVNDYNATLANKTWYQKQAFSWATDMETTCQPALLTVGRDLTTTNQGFQYTIESFRRVGNESSIPLTASYKNGSLSDCQVQDITIELLRSNQARLARNYWTWGATVARSTTECTVDTDDGGPLKVNLTSQLPPAGRYGEISDSFLALKDFAHPGRYIGSQLIGAWYIKLSNAMSYSVPGSLDDASEDASSWGSGTIKLARKDVMDYTSLDFFTVSQASFQYNNGRGLSFLDVSESPKTIRDWKDQWTVPTSGGRANVPNISIVVDAFSKAYYSLLLSDFSSFDEVQSTNALSTGQGLEYLQNITDTDLVDATLILGDTEDGRVGPFTSASTNLTQPLDFAQHTTIVSRYICSIPRPKSTFKLLFAVAVADIVFLSTCWRIFGWIAGWWLGRKDSHAQDCIGCVNTRHDIPLALAQSFGAGGSYSQVSSDAEDERRGNRGRLSAPEITRVHSGV